MLYSEKVMEHLYHPHNVGKIEDADGIGQVGNAKCGDIMRMYIKVDNDVITDVKFNTFGCGSAIATSSMATDMIKGRPIRDALTLSNQAVVEALDGLPARKIHCSVLAEEAVKAAVKEFPGETNFSVITGDGSFFSFNVVYKEEPSTLNINMDQWMNPDEGEKKGGSSIRVTELGEEDPTVIASVMYTIHRLDRRDVKHIGCRQFGMQALLKGIYVHKDLIFFHVSLTNNSNVPFDVDFVRFKIVDKKIAKRTAQQETYIEPVRTLNALTRIEGKSTGRIVYAFPKIVIPDDKLLEVEIYEKGGGRHQRFYIENSDLVDARIVNELIGE